MINLDYLSDILAFFIKDDATFNALKKDFPEILADLISFKQNPNCSCRNRVTKFFFDKVQTEPNLLDKYIYDKDKLIAELQAIDLSKQQNNYSGRIFLIDKTEAAWNTLTKELNNNKFFRGFSVVERDNQIAVYLL